MRFIIYFLILITFSSNVYSSLLKGVRKVQLDNGLLLITKEDHSIPLVSVQVWVKVGSVYEDDSTSGLSHFLEHLVFKGTKNYDGPEISKRIETQGGILNAATSKEFTHFYIDIQKEGLEETVKILSDLVFNATFPADEVEKERPVVVEEIKRHEDNPHAVLYDSFCAQVFPVTPYKQRVLGSANVVENVTRQEIIDYYKKFYTPSNMVVSIVGDMDAKKTAKLVKDTFGKHSGPEIKDEPDLIEPEHGAEVTNKKKDVAQVYLIGGFLGPVIDSDEQFAADVASTILGGGRASRLNQKIREEMQLAYSIGATFWTQRGSGVITFSSTFNQENEERIIKEIKKEVEELRDRGPSAEELERAKQIIKSQWHFSNETFHDKASLFGYWYLQGYPRMIKTYISGIEKVRKDDIMKFIKKYYDPQGITFTLVTPE
ncbi:MAG: insulinase family protein [Endomicrobiales bacterium]|nr:insulinase family protein [Endomicrobiales bacterium]